MEGEESDPQKRAPNFRSRLIDYIRREALPADKLGHQPRLYRLATLVGQGTIYDDDVVFAAAWLHDLGVFLGHRPKDSEALAVWDHVRYAMEQAPELLLHMGFPPDKIPAVIEAIRTHQPSSGPETIEGRILRDADILEQLGSIGILRIAAKIGRDTRYSTFTEAASTLRKNLTELPDKLHFERAKTLARPRINLLTVFLKELDAEASGDLF